MVARFLTRFAAATLFVATAACGDGLPDVRVAKSSLARNESPAPSDDARAKLRDGQLNFAVSLLKTLAVDRPGQELFISPHTVLTAFGMAYAGMAGVTAEEAARVFGFEGNPDVHATLNAVDLALARRTNPTGGGSGSDGKGFRLAVDNTLWSDESFPMEAPFLDTLAVHYGAGVNLVNFRKKAEEARSKVNQWVKVKTEGRIPALLAPGTVNEMTRLLLVNTVYFNAAWLNPFTADTLNFTLADGTKRSVEAMEETATYGFVETEAFQAVSIPYEGEALDMVIVVPKADLATFEANLTGLQLGEIFSTLTPTSAQLILPKWTFSGEPLQLNGALQTLGLKSAFTPAANFTAMTPEPNLMVDDVWHQAFVRVTEKGTEAAAATAVESVSLSAEAPPKVIPINRPYLYLLRDIETSTVLFLGHVLDPKFEE
jgi:serpin B